MVRKLALLLALPVIFGWQAAQAAGVLYEHVVTASSHATTGAAVAADSIAVDNESTTYTYSDWFPLTTSVFSSEQNKFVDVVPDIYRFSFEVNGASADNDSAHVRCYIQTSEDKTSFSLSTVLVDSFDVLTPSTGSQTHVLVEGSMARSEFLAATPLAKWGRLAFTGTDPGDDMTYENDSYVHFPLKVRGLSTTTPNGAVCVINQTVLDDAIVIAKEAGTSVYSDWFPLYTKVYSQSNGRMVDVAPDEYFFTFDISSTSTDTDYVACQVHLQTSEDKITTSIANAELIDLDETAVSATADIKNYYGAEITRSSSFTDQTPFAKWGRLVFSTDANDHERVDITSIRYRGMVTSPVEENMVMDVAVYGPTTGVSTDTIIVVDDAVSYSNWFPLEVGVRSDSRNKSITVFPDVYQFTVKVRDIDATGTATIDMALQTSEDKTIVSDVSQLGTIDASITAAPGDGAYCEVGGAFARTSFSDVCPAAKWGRVVFTNNGDSTYHKSVHRVKVRGFVTTPTQ